MIDTEITVLSEQLGKALLNRNWTITTAESCTGGGISKALTDIAGSSSWFHQAFVTYSNESKTQLLGVPSQLMQCFGAVSEEVVSAMLSGALERSQAELAVAVSGIAGPDGGTEAKPVGTVWLAWGSSSKSHAHCFQFDGSRTAVREQAIKQAIVLCKSWISEQK